MLTKQDLEQIARTFNLQLGDTLLVRDGVVSKDEVVWWRAEYGPEQVSVEDHWDNIKKFPYVYQLAEPEVRVVYLDEE